MSKFTIPYILITGLAMGSSLVAFRFGVGQFHPITFVTVRLFLASIGFLLIYVLGHRRLPWPKQWQLWRHSLVASFVGPAIQMTTIAIALQYLSSGLVAILVSMMPVLIVLMAHLFLPEEKLSRQRAVGVLLAMAGAMLLAIQRQNGLPDVTASGLGYALVGICLLSATIDTIYTRKYMQPYDPFDVTSLRIMIGATIMIVISIVWTGFDLKDVNAMGYFSVTYVAVVGTMLALAFRFDIIKRYGATVAAMINYVIPVSAAIGGVLLLDEYITLSMAATMAIILLGIALVTGGPLINRLAMGRRA